MMDLSDEKRKIIQAVTTAQRKRRKVKEIEKHQSLVREARSTTSVLGFISISAPSDPHLTVCKFLAGSDAPSIREFARDFEESWFDHWEEVNV